jgi:hypothetical protein
LAAVGSRSRTSYGRRKRRTITSRLINGRPAQYSTRQKSIMAASLVEQFLSRSWWLKIQRVGGAEEIALFYESDSCSPAKEVYRKENKYEGGSDLSTFV